MVETGLDGLSRMSKHEKLMVLIDLNELMPAHLAQVPISWSLQCCQYNLNNIIQNSFMLLKASAVLKAKPGTKPPASPRQLAQALPMVEAIPIQPQQGAVPLIPLDPGHHQEMPKRKNKAKEAVQTNPYSRVWQIL